MLTFDLEIELRSYIADPYWPERERLVNIQKESGMSRARSAANRRKALEEYLRSEGMTLKDYDELEVTRARREASYSTPPLAGAGSTGVAAADLGRSSILIDIDANCHAAAEKRLAQTSMALA
jgi:hypothetical protein